MRAIIITDAEARSLLDQLELECFKKGRWNEGLSSKDMEEALRIYNYIVIVVGWLNEMGANLNK